MLISIIVPIYNSEKYLERCLTSIIHQTYEKLEIILVNDSSSDNSLNIIKKYAKKDKRIILINQEKSGALIARKKGVRKSCGEYCLIVDSDDWLGPKAIEVMVNYLKNYPNVDIIKCNFMEYPTKRIHYLTKECLLIENKEAIINQFIYSGKWNNLWNSLIKRNLFNFDDAVFQRIVHKGEDIQVNLQVLDKTKKVLLIPDILYHYYINMDGITQKMYPEKFINNMEDYRYLNECYIKLLNKKKIKIQDDNLAKNFYLKFINNLKLLLINYDYQKEDLIYIEKELQKKGFNDIFRKKKLLNIKLNVIQKIVSKKYQRKELMSLMKDKLFFKVIRLLRIRLITIKEMIKKLCKS